MKFTLGTQRENTQNVHNTSTFLRWAKRSDLDWFDTNCTLVINIHSPNRDGEDIIETLKDSESVAAQTSGSESPASDPSHSSPLESHLYLSVPCLFTANLLQHAILLLLSTHFLSSIIPCQTLFIIRRIHYHFFAYFVMIHLRFSCECSFRLNSYEHF